MAVGWQVYEITGRPLDLGYVGDEKQLRPDVFDTVAQLALGKAVTGEAVDDAERIAEVVVEAVVVEAIGGANLVSPAIVRGVGNGDVAARTAVAYINGMQVEWETFKSDIDTACATLDKKGGAHASERKKMKQSPGY